MATRKVHGHGYVGTLFTSILTNENRVTPFLLSELWMDRSTRSWCYLVVPSHYAARRAHQCARKRYYVRWWLSTAKMKMLKLIIM